MSKQDFLLEVGVEEMPARYVSELISQLEQNTQKWFEKYRISFEQVTTFSTPRRLAVLVSGVADRQADLHEEVKGPPARIAKTPEGEWSKAAEGFARKNGVSVDQLELRELKGESYLFANVHQPGGETFDILSSAFHEALQAFQPPKTMRWDQYRFVRPVRWLVALLGASSVPISWSGVTAGNLTRGHRFLGEEVMISEPALYEDVLRGQYVIVNAEARKQAIVQQIRYLEEENNWTIPIHEGLLEEVTNLVEYPTALSGTFDEAFLQVPDPVLTITMREHQRYFPVQDLEGKLLPFFITIRNGDHQHLALVAKGNEKVLSARLADARFFYEEDLKTDLSAFQAKLEQIVFFEGLGTMADRVRRIQCIAGQMGRLLQLDEKMLQDLDRAASLCKFDLATQMVGELPELEGFMGSVYAQAAGESQEVAYVIDDHHKPRFAGDEMPDTLLGTILSVADKMDTLCATFGIGVQPTGSQDPYGLRRRATGLIQLFLSEHLRGVEMVDVIQIVEQTLRLHNLVKLSPEQFSDELYPFLILRFRNILQDADLRYDVVEAIAESGFSRPALAVERAHVLQAKLEREEFKLEVEGFTRVANLAAKADDTHVQPDLLVETSEKQLAKSLELANEAYRSAYESENALGMYDAIAGLTPEIHHFFDHVMVMVEDEEIRKNRLALLREITNTTRTFAAFEQIVFPS
ncbi:glycine--tRNA ligase subunit beta [Baia soyae]|uniref:Glycine--tRNA ligase beta subunit n=1 Tax=Baia soyae TaxID=1544746 RepID=A0A4R2S1A5_9BACL|nr:glycine--tRNA ligase subunit beta [Baia soyae]TCP65115.1 glycyl-tRNA synthetase beta chain [Baia soyae]